MIAHIQQADQPAVVQEAGARTVVIEEHVIKEHLPLDSEYALYNLMLESANGKPLIAALASLHLSNSFSSRRNRSAVMLDFPTAVAVNV
ncbi:hypothetical protein IFO70_24985 [Phormidium tenue FACHB-886]|nr:hypothetical protein [Phormidium tenue FACHB-886]